MKARYQREYVVSQGGVLQGKRQEAEEEQGEQQLVL